MGERPTYDDRSIWPPALSWGSGFAEGMKYALLIAEDHSYTFRTVEMRHKRDANGRVFDPNPHLPYGPETSKKKDPS